MVFGGASRLFPRKPWYWWFWWLVKWLWLLLTWPISVPTLLLWWAKPERETPLFVSPHGLTLVAGGASFSLRWDCRTSVSVTNGFSGAAWNYIIYLEYVGGTCWIPREGPAGDEALEALSQLPGFDRAGLAAAELANGREDEWEFLCWKK
jgi:hypothetical protein